MRFCPQGVSPGFEQYVRLALPMAIRAIGHMASNLPKQKLPI